MKAHVLCAAALVTLVACKKDAAPSPAPAGQGGAAASASAPAKAGAPAAAAAPAAGGSAAPVAAAPAAGGNNAIAARYLDKEVTMDEVDKSIAKELTELRKNAAEKLVLKALVGLEAKKAGTDEQGLLKSVVAKAGPVTDEEIKKFFESKKDQLAGRKYEEVKPLIQQQLEQGKQRELVGAFIDQLKKSANVKYNFVEPRIQVAATGPVKGPETAPITIVEFSDFECPFCTRGKEAMDKVVAAYPGKIKLVFRDFPLPFHQNAQKASEAGLCANEQGKFWEMHDKMFGDQKKLGVADLKATAKALGVDATKFDTCLDSGQHAATVKKNMEEGQAAGVNGTPAFFINGRLLSGALPFEKFKEVIDEELAGK